MVPDKQDDHGVVWDAVHHAHRDRADIEVESWDRTLVGPVEAIDSMGFWMRDRDGRNYVGWGDALAVRRAEL